MTDEKKNQLAAILSAVQSTRDHEWKSESAKDYFQEFLKYGLIKDEWNEFVRSTITVGTGTTISTWPYLNPPYTVTSSSAPEPTGTTAHYEIKCSHVFPMHLVGEAKDVCLL